MFKLSFNRLVDGVEAKIALHVCYGNYQLKKLFKGQYGELACLATYVIRSKIASL